MLCKIPVGECNATVVQTFINAALCLSGRYTALPNVSKLPTHAISELLTTQSHLLRATPSVCRGRPVRVLTCYCCLVPQLP